MALIQQCCADVPLKTNKINQPMSREAKKLRKIGDILKQDQLRKTIN